MGEWIKEIKSRGNKKKQNAKRTRFFQKLEDELAEAKRKAREDRIKQIEIEKREAARKTPRKESDPEESDRKDEIRIRGQALEKKNSPRR